MFLSAGTRVRYDGVEDGQPEYGVVIHCWFNDEIQAHDCYIAFFGNDEPVGALNERPYILRYASNSLTVL